MLSLPRPRSPAAAMNFIVFFLFAASDCEANDVSHHRSKRILHFPEKTNVVLTVSLLKLMPSETILNTLTELDVAFPVPIHPYHHSPTAVARKKREIERTTIYANLLAAINYLGINGQSCFNSLLCKMMLWKRHDDNLLLDIAGIILNFSRNNTEQVPATADGNGNSSGSGSCDQLITNTCRSSIFKWHL